MTSAPYSATQRVDTSSLVTNVFWYSLRITEKTCWSFIEVVDAAGRVGVGEATLSRREREMKNAFEKCKDGIIARTPLDADLDTPRTAARSLPEFAVVSALDQALCDLAAQQRGISVGEALGEYRRRRIPVYANINRGITTRTPEGFAAHANRAVDDGFLAVKIAPFDEIELYGDSTKSVDSDLLDAGIARIEAVRDAIGPNVELMVDCHWRLHRSSAEAVLRATAPLDLYWLECPVPEKAEMMGTLREIRKLANDRGVRLAGCEEMSLIKGFMPFLQANVYDVMMPDAKYVGGMQEMLAVAATMEQHKVGFSPHNPSGPICHAASLQICAVAPNFERLEMQYCETPLFNRLVNSAIPPAVKGEIQLSDTPGFGVRLEPSLVRELQLFH